MPKPRETHPASSSAIRAGYASTVSPESRNITRSLTQLNSSVTGIWRYCAGVNSFFSSSSWPKISARLNTKVKVPKENEKISHNT